MRKHILASTSARRRELMKKLGVPFTVAASRFNERSVRAANPHSLVAAISKGKARAVAKKHKNAIVIGADTIVVRGTTVFGKPRSTREALAMLRALNGKVHTVLTAFTVVDAHRKREVTKVIATKVYFRKATERELRAYVATGEPLDKAGAYALQGYGALLIRKIEGDFWGAVGLPVAALSEELLSFGVRTII